MPISATVTRLTSAEPPEGEAAEASLDDDSDSGAGGGFADALDDGGSGEGGDLTAVLDGAGSGADVGSAAALADNGAAGLGKRIGLVIWALATALASANAQNHPSRLSRIFNLC
ncbi:MAG: hypothetical protein GX937_12950 [Lentisphaerae bacterium]|jgi:hypothetical protein|nr:hypothetical protein [Lentisphaerota bacterium]